MRYFLCVVFLALSAVALQSCTAEQVGLTRTQLLEIREHTVTARDEEEVRGNTKAVDYANEVIARIDQALLEIARNSAADGSIPLNSIVTGVVSFAPFPWNVAVLSIFGGITAFQQWRVRQNQLKKEEANTASRSIVNSMDVLRMNEPVVKELMAKHKDSIRSELTTHAIRVVDTERLGD